MDECTLTTYDNPFNPFDDFEHWFQFDSVKGYGTCELLARFLPKEFEVLSEVEQNVAISNAINRILAIDLESIYKKVFKSDFKTDSKTDSKTKTEN